MRETMDTVYWSREIDGLEYVIEVEVDEGIVRSTTGVIVGEPIEWSRGGRVREWAPCERDGQRVELSEGDILRSVDLWREQQRHDAQARREYAEEMRGGAL